YALRWFTPQSEIDLCRHATLASAFLVFGRLEPSLSEVHFETRSGTLRVSRDRELIALDFPARPAEPYATPPRLAAALGAVPRGLAMARAHVAFLKRGDQGRPPRPDLERLKGVGCFALVASAPGREADFVSRFFAPRLGVPEDPVTGSAHSTLIPYWA